MLLATTIAFSLVALACARSIVDCGDSCFTEAFAVTDCSLKDSFCVCTSQTFVDSFSECVEVKCTEQDTEALLKQAEEFCSEVGRLEKRDASPPWNNNNGWPSWNRNGPGKPGQRPRPNYNWRGPGRPGSGFNMPKPQPGNANPGNWHPKPPKPPSFNPPPHKPNWPGKPEHTVL